MTKVYHYIYYRTYAVISKTNKLNAKFSSKSLLSFSVLFNVFTIFFFLKIPSDIITFYGFLSIGIVLGFLNLKYFNENRIKLIILEFNSLEIHIVCKYLVDIYPWLSILLFLVSTGANDNTIFSFIGILTILRLVQFLYEM